MGRNQRLSKQDRIFGKPFVKPKWARKVLDDVFCVPFLQQTVERVSLRGTKDAHQLI
ncbi:hypothetical protein [Parageobacillus thermoglucosidasius]|uniref:hypothetical protein n=1 Tax=Parageobacillus thermoglucosidasius TaxID=1426 RepID=UPI001E594296|nr:hypothetical protein [Parageobacillus thermoglucosidasius]